jgi:hypothetical protein
LEDLRFFLGLPALDSVHVRSDRFRRLGGLRRAGESEGEPCGAEPDDFPVGQRLRTGNPFVTDPRAVLAPEVFDRHVTADHDTRMTPRYRWQVDLDNAVYFATEDVLSGVESDTFRFSDQPSCGSLEWIARRRSIADNDISVKAVADAVNGANPGLPCPANVDGVPDLMGKSLQAGFGDKRVGPEPRVDLLFRNSGGPALEEQQQQIECLAGQVHGFARVGHRASVCVDTDVAEGVFQGLEPGVGSRESDLG